MFTTNYAKLNQTQIRYSFSGFNGGQFSSGTVDATDRYERDQKIESHFGIPIDSIRDLEIKVIRK
ncbi:MAG: hypothetical protein ACRCXZ_09705 [Patescibacteria group bacterium]